MEQTSSVPSAPGAGCLHCSFQTRPLGADGLSLQIGGGEEPWSTLASVALQREAICREASSLIPQHQQGCAPFSDQRRSCPGHTTGPGEMSMDELVSGQSSGPDLPARSEVASGLPHPPLVLPSGVWPPELASRTWWPAFVLWAHRSKDFSEKACSHQGTEWVSLEGRAGVPHTPGLGRKWEPRAPCTMALEDLPPPPCHQGGQCAIRRVRARRTVRRVSGSSLLGGQQEVCMLFPHDSFLTLPPAPR